jgi:hypothetical protein
MLARRLTTILPAMTLAEAIETTHIHSVAGLTGGRTSWVTTRPFRVPHHTISDAGLIGGQLPMSGEVSLAYHDVLFLDELPEFRRRVLEVLRQPLKNGILYRQSRARPRRQCFRSLNCTADDLKGLGLNTVATPAAAAVPTPEVSPACPSTSAPVAASPFSLDTGYHVR